MPVLMIVTGSSRHPAHLTYGLVAVGVGRKVGGVRDLLLAGQAVGLFQIQPNILHVRVGQGAAAGPVLPADGPQQVYTLGQQILCQRPG